MASSKHSLSRYFPGVSQIRLPSVVTSLSIVLGSAGTIAALTGKVSLGLLCLIIAVPCDMLDGALARRLKLTSAFGAELDSLADLISFVLLPCALIWGLLAPGVPGACLLLFYILGGAWRLAHFNTESEESSGAFRGIPTTYMGGVLAAALGGRHSIDWGVWQGLIWGLVTLGPWFMLSAMPFKKGGWHYKGMAVMLVAVGALELYGLYRA